MLLKCLGFCHSKDTSASKGQYPTVIEELCHHFSPADLRKSTNNFDENQLIGRGGFGSVYKGCLKHNGVSDYTVALKRSYRNNYGEFVNYGEFKNEIELLCQLRHANLVSLIGFCNLKHEKIIVYDYIPNGTFHDHLHDRDRDTLSWKKRLEICIGAACGVHYLHTGAKRTIIHLDGQRFMSKPKPIEVDRICGTFGFMAPEYTMYGTVTDKCDVYSFGRLLLEVVLEKPISSIQSSKPAWENIDPNLKGNIAPECWEVFMDITERCLKEEADERPTMGEVEVQLELALSLQEEADSTTTNGKYTLLSNTIIKLGPEFEDSVI
ncbi:receptor-like protein kinase ANXUR2 isoform X2 [Gastrolobium bilobum]|uniref:receptor-like protein kinase ANXUR2 isoform X2 n=1 Tax=Gastrolobium bilobum TaxID=150636 RepID=UPI002AB2425C|nr:receptor-like protein kinase ANXUR2 isoform X2 [Gastrolobium bilobum]